MWLQILAALIPTLGVLVPLLSYNMSRAKSRAEIALAEKMGTAALNGGNSASMARAIEADRSTPAARAKDSGHQRFLQSLQELERRVLENSNRNIYGYLQSLLEELQILDAKLKSAGIDQQARLTYAKYLPIVGKVLELTAPSKYGDFIANPNHWSDPKRMRIQVELSVLAVAKEVAEDVRRLNGSQELNFQVSVESIIGKAAGAAEKPDEDSAIAELLKPTEGIGEVDGTLDSLENAVAREAIALRARQELEAQKTAEEEAIKKFKAGSKRSLEAKSKGHRPTLLSKDRYQQRWTIYGQGSSDTKFLVVYSNAITGESSWKEFPTGFEAAKWVDSAMLAEEAKHDFKCDCVYCRDDEDQL